MGIITQIAGLLLSLSILIIFHELGHFFFAKLFKTRVEKFYLFFNPWKSLFKIKRGETEYGIGWLPLGGYVKIAGMIDESLDTKQMNQPPQPWEFRAKPAWQRLLIMIGGVLVNFLLALVIYSGVLFFWGKEYLPVENLKYGIVCDTLALQAGLQNGDKIIKVGNKKIEQLPEVMKALVIDDAPNITLLRNNELLTIPIPNNIKQKLVKHHAKTFFIDVYIPFIVDSVIPNKPAHKAGFIKNDSIIAINNIPTPTFQEFAQTIQRFKNQLVTISVIRDTTLLQLKTQIEDEGIIGVYNKPIEYFFKLKKENYSLVKAIPAGISMGLSTLGGYIKSLRLLFTKEGAKQIGGFGAIGGLYSKTWDWNSFWRTTALISLLLAFMNILPIPALDGGHVLFLSYELITRRKPSDKFLEYAQITGMIILFSLLIYANANDIIRAIAN